MHVDTWRTTYRGIIADQFLDSLSYEDRQASWEIAITRGGLIYVVEEENNVIGFVACGKEREVGIPRFIKYMTQINCKLGRLLPFLAKANMAVH